MHIKDHLKIRIQWFWAFRLVNYLNALSLKMKVREF